MKKIFLLLLVSVASLQSLQAQKEVVPDKKELTEKMLASIRSLKSLKFRLWKQERLKGKMEIGEQEVKMMVKPFKAYLFNYLPNVGAEVLFLEGQNDNKALVNPNSFPWTNLNLDPFGDILRKGQHHTLFELGFEYTGGLLTDVYKKFGTKLNEYCTIEGSIHYANRDCWKVLLENKDYKLVDYTVLPGENLIKIAKKLWVSEYALLEMNNLRNYDAVKPGQKIKVPTSYAKKVVLYIDKINHLPIYQQLFDDKGLFAEYKYSNLLVNPKLTEEEFTKGYKGYKF
jgi:outer membrane lipoprotein-sorting protein